MTGNKHYITAFLHSHPTSQSPYRFLERKEGGQLKYPSYHNTSVLALIFSSVKESDGRIPLSWRCSQETCTQKKKKKKEHVYTQLQPYPKQPTVSLWWGMSHPTPSGIITSCRMVVWSNHPYAEFFKFCFLSVSMLFCLFCVDGNLKNIFMYKHTSRETLWGWIKRGVETQRTSGFWLPPTLQTGCVSKGFSLGA